MEPEDIKDEILDEMEVKIEKDTQVCNLIPSKLMLPMIVST
jgi:hypothetical protein